MHSMSNGSPNYLQTTIWLFILKCFTRLKHGIQIARKKAMGCLLKQFLIIKLDDESNNWLLILCPDI